MTKSAKCFNEEEVALIYDKVISYKDEWLDRGKLISPFDDLPYFSMFNAKLP